MKILRLGHAMYIFKSNSKKNYLIDPFFDMNPGCPKEYDDDDFFKSIDTVFLTHGHFDHTSGLQKVLTANPDVLVVAQYELALILLQKGVKNVYPINLGGSILLEDATVTMVPAKHSSSFGEMEGTPIYAGQSAGYVFDFDNSHTVYHSGDTAVTYDIKLIQELYEPTIAILSSSGHFTMGPKDAAYTVRNLLDVDYVIPSHTFPTKETAASSENFELLLAASPIVEKMMDKDNELAELLKDYDRTKVVVLGYGEEYEF
ncbi:metal-dependent hydrolase [Sporosarcina limicola]|uniref:L-ascorbate metabolism protein UlaG (Beta-lactamase superfamily) n=1 Tax=Sporosarcina limicola TaxID=34101 RepID=A0A927MKZ7_9BACL|nr:metal-dependent hydrolase [Sporosarcina limicola]MBE1556640.1 L-ascorbate metabolism protein UlaG (beta-lactamase superfamily) [Sporosarcina limicola]